MLNQENEKRTFRPFAIATGVAAGSFMRDMVDLLLEKCDNKNTKLHAVYSIENSFFGPDVTVAGLLTPGTLIDICKVNTMRCRMVMRPAMLVLFALTLVIAMVGCLTARGRNA